MFVDRAGLLGPLQLDGDVPAQLLERVRIGAVVTRVG